jgi:hypothetical protein
VRRLVFSLATASCLLPVATLWPFLDDVHSQEADATVTSASLTAPHEVMVLTGHSLPGSALREVGDTVASCRFEAGAEANAKEAVLMWMLQALLACLRARAATALGYKHHRQHLLSCHAPGVYGNWRDFCLSFFLSPYISVCCLISGDFSGFFYVNDLASIP